MLFLGDNVEVMHREIADNSIQLTVTSPPYDNLRKYNGFTWDFPAVAKELYRVTKPGGVVVWVVADATVNGSETGTSFRQALYFKECGFNLHDTMIWRKTCPTPVDPRIGRYTAAFEFMFVFTKGRLLYPFENLQRVPCKMAGHIGTHSPTQLKADGSLRLDRVSKRMGQSVKDTKILDNVWDCAVSGGVKGHPASFPERLIAPHILSWSNPGDTVLDPFLGSGTTGKMAAQLGRSFIGIEIDAEYFNVAQWRIAMAQAERLMSA